MSRALIISFVAALSLAPGIRPAVVSGQAQLFVNTTLDLPYEASHCLPGLVCTLRAAIEKAQSFPLQIRVCFDGNCPPGALPLTTDDPGFDPVTGRWTITYGDSFQPYVVTGDGSDLDFTAYVEGWRSPADNKIVLDAGMVRNHLMIVQGTNNKFAGIEFHGEYDDAVIIVRRGASGNQFGPALVFAGLVRGNGIRILDAGTSGNRVVGNWCGLTGGENGEVVEAGLLEDCVHIAEGANDNIVGGPDPADRNVFAGSKLGFGVSLHDAATRNNVVAGNYIGTDPSGTKAMGNESGIAIFDEAQGTHVHDNLLSGNRNAGVFLQNASTEFGRSTTLIEDNIIGADVSGQWPLPNDGYGLSVEGLSKRTLIQHNLIHFNRTGGVLVCGELTKDNTVTENSITENNGSAIHLCSGANEGVQPPVLTSGSKYEVAGTACPGCRVEVYSDPAEEAAVFEGTVTAGSDGSFTLRKPAGFTFTALTATATDGKNTSALSSPPLPIGGRPTLTPTPGAGTPKPATPTPTLHSSVAWIYLPIVLRDWLLQ